MWAEATDSQALATSNSISKSYLGIRDNHLGLSNSSLCMGHSYSGKTTIRAWANQSISNSHLGISNSYLGKSNSHPGTSNSYPDKSIFFPGKNTGLHDKQHGHLGTDKTATRAHGHLGMDKTATRAYVHMSHTSHNNISRKCSVQRLR